MKPSEVARRRASHTIGFGDPKSGKSTDAASLIMAGFKVTWISLDNGHEIVFKLPCTPEYLDEHLNLIILPDTKDFPIASTTCLKIVTGKEVRICDAHGQVDCATCKGKGIAATWSIVHANAMGQNEVLVFDHIGQLANSVMNNILKGKPDDYKPEWEHYRIQGTLMDKFLTNIQQAKYNVHCITHTVETEMEDGSKRLVPMVGTVAFSRNVGKYFDHIIYYRLMNKSHRMGSSTTYENKILTGSRTDISVETAEKPGLAMFFNGTILPSEKLDTIEAQKRLEQVQRQAAESKVDVEEVLGTSEVSQPVETVPEQPTVQTTPLTQPAQPSASDLMKARLALLKGNK